MVEQRYMEGIALNKMDKQATGEEER